MMDRNYKAQVRAMSKIDAAKELYNYDHAFIGREGCEFFAEVLGVKLPTRFWKGRSDASASNPKGLVMAPGTEGSEGLDAVQYTGWLAEQLGLGNPGGMYSGRGFALRANVDAIVKHFETTATEADEASQQAAFESRATQDQGS